MNELAEAMQTLDALGNEHQSESEEPEGMRFLAERAGLDYEALREFSRANGMSLAESADPFSRSEIAAVCATAFTLAFLAGIEFERKRDA